MLEGDITGAMRERAAMIADERRSESRRDGRAARSHSGGVSGSFDELGALGEVVAEVAFGLSYNGAAPPGRSGKAVPDVGPLEVQTSGPNLRLIVRPSDGIECLQRPYVHVIVDGDRWRIPGWIFGTQAEELGVWDNPGGGKPALFVSDSALGSFANVAFWCALADFRIHGD